MIHALYALALQIAAWLLTGNPWAGAVIACGFFLGREIAQAEYRWIEAYGFGRRENYRLRYLFTDRAWTFKGMLDWVLPIVATGVVAVTIIVRG